MREISGVRMAYVDLPIGATSRVLQRKAGLDEWLSGRSTAIISGETPVFNTPGEYMTELRRVLEALRPMLHEDAAVCVHASQRFSAYARLTLDEVLGRSAFVNEIIWDYGASGRAATHFLRGHDTILLYRNGKNMVFHPEVCARRRGRERTNHMRRGVDGDGRVYFSARLGDKEYRYYEDDMMTPNDVWGDVAALGAADHERTGLEPQRPESLLTRLIASLSDEGDRVLAPYDTAGSFAASAAKLKRACAVWYAEDASLLCARRRVLEAGAGLTLTAAQETAPFSARWECSGEKVWLKSFALTGRESANPLLNDGLFGLDLWATGHMDGKTFCAENFSMRSWAAPTLRDTLPLGAQGSGAILLLDAWGNAACFAAQGDG
ncbi:MAG: DNA methyltransferase [Eubacteriales bacterium]|nr:DNA methyltransferase [Eubacteriales bacterium]